MLRTEKNISDFQRELMKWGNKNFQKFPWRDIDDPYKILVSEFMLHRTRALQVEPVYSTFIEDYPSLELFSQAKPQDIKEELSTLGLSWRIDNLINALREIHNKYDSVPSNYDILISFHGIGQYIAGATVCFSSNQNISLVDTNTLRVIGRYWGFPFDEKSRKKKETSKIIGTVTESETPKKLYYAIIDLAHLICIPLDPECSKCPLLKAGCIYSQSSI